jgi:decaprenylphospho-beta-D-ribofuranose 2-oxidase
MQITERVSTSGWGNNFHSLSARAMVKTVAQLQEIVASASSGRGLLPVGLHRSYGDSALNSGGTLLEMTGLNTISIDPISKIATVGAGASITELEYVSLAYSLFPPVVPGTGFVTMGGAVAADIHGKSHHKTGSFSQSLRRIALLLSSGEIAEYGICDPQFWATVGGMGLTGVILEVDIELRAVASNSVEVSEHRVQSLEQMLELLTRSDADYEHTVAWIDLSGDYKGRGVVSLGNYGDTNINEKGNPMSGPSLPSLAGKNFITPLSVKAFNEIWYRKPLKQGPVLLEKYMHPLDGINNWNKIYGNQGFLQYQFVIDVGQEQIFERLFAGLRELKAASFLGVLKKFGKASDAPLSFPRPGWTLTLDYSTAVPGLEAFLRKFDQELVSAGGRIYLVKDSRVDSALIPTMYPELNGWREIRDTMDPTGLWKSDQARRLQLC